MNEKCVGWERGVVHEKFKYKNNTIAKSTNSPHVASIKEGVNECEKTNIEGKITMSVEYVASVL